MKIFVASTISDDFKNAFESLHWNPFILFLSFISAFLSFFFFSVYVHSHLIRSIAVDLCPNNACDGSFNRNNGIAMQCVMCALQSCLCCSSPNCLLLHTVNNGLVSVTVDDTLSLSDINWHLPIISVSYVIQLSRKEWLFNGSQTREELQLIWLKASVASDIVWEGYFIREVMSRMS